MRSPGSPQPSAGVCEVVAARNLCVGCGACVAVCPRKRLHMDWNAAGCYEVRESDAPCASSCAVCVRVCPFADGNPNEDEIARGLYGALPGINHRTELGYYLSCCAGHVVRDEQRIAGASGGLATWFLCKLLDERRVDHVVCVRPHSGSETLFEFTICDNKDEVRRSSRSAYYPVEMSEVLRRIRESPGRFAITCLPCFAKALRLASEESPPLKERLAAVVGLVCGHTVSSFFSDYVARLAELPVAKPSRVTFRTKNPSLPAYELGTECACEENGRETVKTVYWSQGPGEAWSNHWFTPNPCLYCDDVFAETADVAFMDAWLPEYVSDYRGTNLLITRSLMAEEVIGSGAASGEIHVEPVPADNIIESQGLVVSNKSRGLSHRLWLAQRAGTPVPAKRMQPKRERSFVLARQWQRYMNGSRIGCAHWRACADVDEFRRRLSSVSVLDRSVKLAAGVRAGLRRVCGRLRRLVLGRVAQ